MAKYHNFKTSIPTIEPEESLPTLIKSDDITKEQFYELCKILCREPEGAKFVANTHISSFINIFQGKYGFTSFTNSLKYYILTSEVLEDFLEKHSLFNISLEDFIREQIK